MNTCGSTAAAEPIGCGSDIHPVMIEKIFLFGPFDELEIFEGMHTASANIVAVLGNGDLVGKSEMLQRFSNRESEADFIKRVSLCPKIIFSWQYPKAKNMVKRLWICARG